MRYDINNFVGTSIMLLFVSVFNYLFDARPPVGVPKSTYEVRNGLSYDF